MNSLKGLGVCVLLAATVLAVRQLAQVDLIILVATIGVVILSKRELK